MNETKTMTRIYREKRDRGQGRVYDVSRIECMCPLSPFSSPFIVVLLFGCCRDILFF